MAKNDELFKVKTLSEAIEILKPYVDNFFTRVEEIPLLDALGRIIAKDIPAKNDLPHFRKSTVDGLAVYAADTFGASESMPALINKNGEIQMGHAPEHKLERGQGSLIPTGGMLPTGADSVVMVENLEDFGEGLLGVTKPIAPGENVIEIGEDLAQGEVILARYSKIRPQEMGLLASQGVIHVPVFPRWHVGILSTGDEIVSTESEPGPAQLRDINGYTLFGQVQSAGAIARYYGIVKDNPEHMRQRITQMLNENDIVLLSGGSSVGARDLSAQLIGELGEPGILFHGLALRPGKPTIGGIVDNKLIFGLPGHPASAMVVFESLVRPLIEASLYRLRSTPLPEGVLTQNLYSGTGREEYVRVSLSEKPDGWQIEPVRGKSGLIRTMVLADGLVHIPLDLEGLQAKQKVTVKLLRE